MKIIKPKLRFQEGKFNLEYTESFKLFLFGLYLGTILLSPSILSGFQYTLLENFGLLPIYLLSALFVLFFICVFSLCFISYGQLIDNLIHIKYYLFNPSESVGKLIVNKKSNLNPDNFSKLNKILELFQNENFFKALDFDILSNSKAYSIYQIKITSSYQGDKEIKTYQIVNKIKEKDLKIIIENYDYFISLSKKYSKILSNEQYLKDLCFPYNSKISFENAYEMYIEFANQIKRLSN